MITAQPIITQPAITQPSTVVVPIDLLHRLLVAAMVDGKTCVLTSTAWYGRATETLQRPTAGPAWGLLLVDLDRFAALNATYGHPAADQILARVAAALRTASGVNVQHQREEAERWLKSASTARAPTRPRSSRTVTARRWPSNWMTFDRFSPAAARDWGEHIVGRLPRLQLLTK